MSDISRNGSKALQPGASAPSVLGPSTPSVLQSDVTSSGWSSYFSSVASSSGPHAHSESPGNAFPFPHLGLRKQGQASAAAAAAASAAGGYSPLSSPSYNPRHISRHWSTPIITSNKGGGSATPLLDLAVCPAHSSDSIGPRHVAVVSRATLKIMDTRPPRPTFANAAASGMRRDSSGSPSRPSSRNAAVEVLDVKSGTKMPRHFFSSVSWGYNASADQIATGGTDGVVMLWHVALQGNKSKDRLLHKRPHHDRAVNQVAFAGPSGVWLISAGQDGSIKLWDTRLREAANGNTSQLTLNTHADPIRALAVHPIRTAPQLFQLCSLNESGALTHWDIRSSRTHQSRHQAHLGPGLCIDWVERPSDDTDTSFQSLFEADQTDSQIGPSSQTWLATCGMDATVKVFPFSESLSSKPVATLHTSAPISRVRWRAPETSELAVVPIHSQGNLSTARPSESTASTLANDIEIWDLRRPYVPKSVIRSGLGTVSALACAPFPDSDLIWATHRDSGLLVQHDLVFDAEKPLSNFPKACLTWSPQGELAFSTEAPRKAQSAGSENPEAPTQISATVEIESGQALSTAELIHFARHAQVSAVPTISDACRHNATLAEEIQSPDLRVAWAGMSALFSPNSDTVLHPDLSQTAEHSALSPDGDSVHLLKITESALNKHPTRHFTYQSVSAAPPNGVSTTQQQRLERSRSMSRQSRQASIPKALADFTEESSGSADDADDLAASSTLTAVPSTASQPSRPQPLAQEDGGAVGRSTSDPRLEHYSLKLPKTVRRAIAHGHIETNSARPPLSGRALSFHGHTHASRATAPTHIDRYSSSESDVNYSNNMQQDELAASTRSKSSTRTKDGSMGPLASSSRVSRSRTRRGPHLALDHNKALASQDKSAQKQPIPGASLASMAIKRERDLQDAIERHELAIRESADAKDALWDSLKDQLTTTLQQMVDQGHLQFTVQLMQILRPTMNFDPLFESRCEMAYLEVLRRLALHQVATAVTKASRSEDVHTTTSVNTTFHTSCGSCGKAILSPPFDRCSRCESTTGAATIVACTICRRANALASGTDFVHCLTCGHAAHAGCLELTRPAALTTTSRPPQCASGCGHLKCPLAVAT